LSKADSTPTAPAEAGDSAAPRSTDPPELYGKSIGAVSRALEIRELFAGEQEPFTVSAGVTKLGYPQSSTSVLLHLLADLGFLEHDRRARTFMPTPRVVFLGLWLHHRLLDEGTLLEMMETLAHESGQVAFLTMQNGIHAQYIHLVAARSSRVGLKPGLLRPLCRFPAGKMLLSTRHDDEVRKIVRHINATDSQYPMPVDVDLLLAELAACRLDGYSEGINTVTEGASSVAMLLPADVSGVKLAVSIAYHTADHAALQPRLRHLLKETLAHYFPESKALPRRPKSSTPQPSYGVLKYL
jgi:DNA-binding IclR family transcriptional regulator